MNGLNLVIFSKNRPAQLELLLRSMKLFWKEWNSSKVTVIYKSDKEYQPGYNTVIELNKWIDFSPEVSFKPQLLRMIDPDKKYIAFDCDDDVFIRPFSLLDKEVKLFENNPDIMTLSLRLDQRYDYCWDSDRPMRIPKFDKDGAWHWAGQDLDWGYPMSVLFNIFRTKEIKPLLEKLDFTGPNLLEGLMAQQPLSNPRMMCYKEARNVNMPLNLVQDVCKNKALDMSLQEMNKQFLSGKVIDLDSIIRQSKNLKSCFSPMEIKWKSE